MDQRLIEQYNSKLRLLSFYQKDNGVIESDLNNLLIKSLRKEICDIEKQIADERNLELKEL